MVTRKKVAAAMKRAAVRARAVGRYTAKRMAVAADAALVDAGQAAEQRQRSRALKAELKTALTKTAKAAAVIAATTATVVAARAVARARRERKTPAPQ